MIAVLQQFAFQKYKNELKILKRKLLYLYSYNLSYKTGGRSTRLAESFKAIFGKNSSLADIPVLKVISIHLFHRQFNFCLCLSLMKLQVNPLHTCSAVQLREKMNRYGNEICDWLANILVFVSLRSVTAIIPHAKKVHHLKASMHTTILSFATFSNFFLSNIFVVLDVIF